MIDAAGKYRSTLAALVLGSAVGLAHAVAPDIALHAGGKKYEARGQGECKSAAQASIYGMAAAMYSVSHAAEGRSLKLTLWQPKAGAAMMNLRISDGKSPLVVDTVKAGRKQDVRGSGTATLRKSGDGGTITIEAVAASGEKISGRIHCASFGGIRAEGG